MQMTVQNAPPAAIDTAVADVRSYCSEAGQSPHDAFGDPRGYAASLAAELPPPAHRTRPDRRRVAALLPLGLGLVLYVVVLLAEDDGQVPISVGHLLLVTVAVPAWVVLTSPWARPRPRDSATPDRPAFDERGWRGLWATLGLAAVAVLLSVIPTGTVFDVPTKAMFGSASALLAIGVLLLLSATRGKADAEPAS